MYRTAEKMEEPEHDAYAQERKRIHWEMALDSPRMREKAVAADSSGGSHVACDRSGHGENIHAENAAAEQPAQKHDKLTGIRLPARTETPPCRGGLIEEPPRLDADSGELEIERKLSPTMSAKRPL